MQKTITKHKTKLAPGGNKKPGFLGLGFHLGFDGGFCHTDKRASEPRSAFKKLGRSKKGKNGY